MSVYFSGLPGQFFVTLKVFHTADHAGFIKSVMPSIQEENVNFVQVMVYVGRPITVSKKDGDVFMISSRPDEDAYHVQCK